MKTHFHKNLFYNIVGSALPILSALITVPFYIREIGAARYGVVSITWILLGYFGFLDFGLSRASANALGRLGHAPPSERSPVFMTAFYLNLSLGFVGGLILYFGGHFLLLHVFKLTGPLAEETMAAFPWMVPMLPLGMVLSVASGSLESRERFLQSNLLNAAGTVMGQVLPLLCAYQFGPTLNVLIPATLLARLLVVVMIYGVAIWSEWPLRLFDFHLAWAKRLFGYGAWVSVSSLLSPLLDSLDQVLIGRLLGPVAIAHYAVPMNLSMRSQVVATALARTLFPRVSRASPAEARDVTEQAVVSLAYGFGAVCGPAILFCGPFVRVWVGDTFAAVSQPVAEILMLGAWANGIGFMPYGLIQGQGRPDLTAKVHAAEVVPFIGGLVLLIHLAGLPGAALAWTLRVAGDCIALLWLGRCFTPTLARALPALILMVACCIFAETTSLAWTASLFMSAAMGCVFLLAGIAMDPNLRVASQTIFAKVTGRTSHTPVSQEVR